MRRISHVGVEGAQTRVYLDCTDAKGKPLNHWVPTKYDSATALRKIERNGKREILCPICGLDK